MNLDIKEIQNLQGAELEDYGKKVFQNIGLTCCSDLGQVRLCNISSSFPENEHIEFDYIIPHNRVCLIGEITSREIKKEIKKKYQKFINHINIIKNLDLPESLWSELGIKQEKIKLFREVEEIKAFFVVTKKEKYNLTLNEAKDTVVFFQSDFLRVIEYSNTIGKWSKDYFLHNFNIRHTSEDSVNIHQIMELQNLNSYNSPLFNYQNINIPDAKYSPAKVYDFLNKNRQKAFSIQNIK